MFSKCQLKKWINKWNKHKKLNVRICYKLMWNVYRTPFQSYKKIVGIWTKRVWRKKKKWKFKWRTLLNINSFFYIILKNEYVLKPSLMDFQIISHSRWPYVYQESEVIFHFLPVGEKGSGEKREGEPFFRYPTKKARCQLKVPQKEESVRRITSGEDDSLEPGLLCQGSMPWKQAHTKKANTWPQGKSSSGPHLSRALTKNWAPTDKARITTAMLSSSSMTLKSEACLRRRRELNGKLTLSLYFKFFWPELRNGWEMRFEIDFLNRTELLKIKSDQKVMESAQDAITWWESEIRPNQVDTMTGYKWKGLHLYSTEWCS